MLLGYILYINQIISDRFFVIWLNGRSSAWISPGYTQHMQVSEKGKLRLFWICGILRVFDGFLRFFAGFLRVNLDVFFGPKWFLHMLWWFSRQFWVTRCKNYDSPLSPPKDSIENGSGSLTLDHLDQDQTTPMEYKSNRSPLCIQVADWRAVVKSPIVLFQAGGTQRFLLYHKYM